MSEKIYKYPFKIVEKQTIKMPSGANVLSVQVQDGVPCIWAKVNDKNPECELKLVVLGTGQEMPEGVMQYISTLQMGQFVWHVFIEEPQKKGISKIDYKLQDENRILKNIRNLLDNTREPSIYAFLMDEEAHVLKNIESLIQMKKEILMSEQP